MRPNGLSCLVLVVNMPGDTSRGSPCYCVMMRQMTGNAAGDRAADAAFRGSRVGGGQAHGDGKKNGGMNDTHLGTPLV